MTKVMRWGAFAAFAMLIATATLMAVAATPPVQAYADEGWRSYVYRWWESGTVKEETRTAYCYDIDKGDNSTIGSGWYLTGEDDTDINLVKIAANSEVNIIVQDGKTQLVDGIYVPASSTLNIYGQSGGSGVLRCVADNASYAGIGGLDGDDPNDGTADCGTINIYGGHIYAEGDDHSTENKEGAAGIGGGYKGSGGTVRIYGGEVEAKGDSDAAGIGGGSYGGGGTVEIYGGTVTTHGGSAAAEGGAGIGGGRNGNGGTIRIYGGNVTASGGHDGAGIGGGDSGSGGDIEIHNGTVTANGWDSAAIGGGQYGHGGSIKIFGGTVNANGGVTSAAIGGGQRGNGGNITISGGNVTATANTEGAGIGGGDAGGNGGNITITGGTIRATGHDGAGIGGGDNGGSSGTIKISGGEITAIAGADAAGIGGGYDGACERVEITGGTIKEAKGGSVNNSGGAGIGGGNGHNGGTIIINNANVTAQGGVDAAGIGGGDGVAAGNGRDGGNITIGGTLSNTIKATGGNYAAGIGGGQYGNGGTITINGGTVEATGGRDGAGIGGGEYGNGGKVTINGGKVTAKGSPGNTSFEGAAGIGGGDGTEGDAYGNGGEVIITGGEVIATGNCDGAGIGGGDQGKGGTVTISGGTVTAKGSDYAAGIGGGDADRNASSGKSHGDGGTVIITGDAHVTAEGGNSGAGIGSGEEGNDGGTVVIGTEGSTTGPTVIANGGKYAAGIGAGDAYIQGGAFVDKAVVGADVTIYSGNVTATGGTDAAGIGGGEGGSNKSTKIYGGTVVATAGQTGADDGGAGIGAGDDNIRELDKNRKNTTGGTIEIHGGNVTATGGPNGAGIGGGDYGSGGKITITDGTVIAHGSQGGAGIGGGQARGAGEVNITGGYIRATGGSYDDYDEGGAGIGGGANVGGSSEIFGDRQVGGADQGQAVGEDDIKISGSAIVVAAGAKCAAGIGGGTNGAPGNVTIEVNKSGRVDATGGIHGTGIGGGSGKDGDGVGRAVNYGVSGKINIKSGRVTATGGQGGGAGIGSGAKCGDPNLDTVNVTVSGGNVIARAGELTDTSGQYDAGVAIGTGGQYIGDEWNDIEIDDGFVIKDVDIPAKFKGTINFNGGRVAAVGASAAEDIQPYVKNALNAVGTSRSSSLNGGAVNFNGGIVWMWNGGVSDGLSAKSYAQAVRANENEIYFKDSPDHQHVWYVETAEFDEDITIDDLDVVNTSHDYERVPALTEYEKDAPNYALVAVEPQHTHSFTYTTTTTVSTDDTIVATCTKNPCTLEENQATLQLVKPRHQQYGDGLDTDGAADATVIDDFLIQGDSHIQYYKTNAAGTAPEGDELGEAPVDAGTYWAQITLGSGSNIATAHVVYTIAKAENPARVSGYAGIVLAEGSTESGSVDLEDNVNLNGYEEKMGDLEVAYDIVGDVNGCTLSGSTLTTGQTTDVNKRVTVKVTVPATDNYESHEATITVTISQKPQRSITAIDTEAVYGQEDPVIVLADLTNSAERTATDIWSMEVKEGYEDIIEVDEGSIKVDDEGEIIDATIPHVKIKKAGEAYVVITVIAGNEDYAPSYAEAKVTIKPAELTIKANDETIDLHTAPTRAYTADGLVGEDTLKTEPTMTYMQGSVKYIPEYADAGTYTIVPSGADADSNYTIKDYVNGTLTVREASPVRVTPTTSVTANGDYTEDLNTVSLAPNIEMNGASGGVHYSFVGDAKGCSITGEGVLIPGSEDGTVIVGVSVDADAVYSALTQALITVTINPKQIQSIYTKPVVTSYGSTGIAIEARVIEPKVDAGKISFAVKEGSEEYIDVDAETGAVTIKKVPSNQIRSAFIIVTAAETKTHRASSEETFVRIDKAPLTIKAKNEMITAGDTPTGPYDVEGLVGGDTLTTQPTLAYQKDGSVVNPAKMPAGTYDIIPSGADADGNYEISYENAVLTIIESQPDPTPTPDPDPDPTPTPDPDPTPSPSPSTGKTALVFDLSGGSLNGVPDAVMIEATVGDTIRMLAAPVKEGYTFKSWKLSPGWELMPGAEYKVDGNHVFTAVWEEQPGSQGQPGSQEAANGISMYRLYNPNSGEHFYTSSLDEVVMVTNAGWHWEGIGWVAPAASDTPVYRLYNSHGGEHHYTVNAGERDMLVAAGWTDEGVGWYSDDAQTVPLYREYNPNAFSCNHNYTSNYAEHTWLASIGWHDEGIAWYGVRSGS